jgi:hypothetical protein
VGESINLRAFLILFLLAAISFSPGCSTHRADVEQQPSALPEALIEEEAPQEPDIAQVRPGISINLAAYVPTPQRAELCGEAAPLHNQEVWERFDKEFTIVVYNNAQIYLWLQRMQRQFPLIEQRLQSLSLPDDLKYFIVEETDLLPNVWLKKASTNRLLGSNFARYDEQGVFGEALNTLLFRVQDLHAKFNNWTLALAAFYCGESRMRELILTQKISDPYQLHLPPITEGRLYRTLAIKAVLNNPERYGYSLQHRAGN